MIKNYYNNMRKETFKYNKEIPYLVNNLKKNQYLVFF